MHICDILRADRIFVDSSGELIETKADALRWISETLAGPLHADRLEIERLLAERERLQSTGIGDGVAIPHTSLEAAPARAAALILAPRGVPFDSIDGEDAKIIFGVIGPKEATGDHLRTLARISRLLRVAGTRQALTACRSAEEAYNLIELQDQGLG